MSGNKKPHCISRRGRRSGSGNNGEEGSHGGSGADDRADDGQNGNADGGDDDGPQYGPHPRPVERLTEDGHGSAAEYRKEASPSVPTRESMHARLAAGRNDVACSDNSTGNEGTPLLPSPSSERNRNAAHREIDEENDMEHASMPTMPSFNKKAGIEKRGGMDSAANSYAAFLSGERERAAMAYAYLFE